MIYSVNGKLIHKSPGLAVVECGGVGMACQVSARTMAKLGNIGDTAFLYTHLNIREDAMELCGFADADEQHVFRLLLSVSGVGVKVALAILSDLQPERFAICVASGDDKTLRKCAGVGPKLAQRLILELKDKIAKSPIADTKGFEQVAAATEVGSIPEAIGALEVLGYARVDATAALAGCDPNARVEDLIKLGLRKLAAKMG